MAIELTRSYQAWPNVKTHPPTVASNIKILAIVEATTVNAVAKNVLEFHRAALELQKEPGDFPRVEISFVTFDRGRSVLAAPPLGEAPSVSVARPLERAPSVSVAPPLGTAPSDNEFVVAARAAGVQVDVIPERRRFDRSVLPALREIILQRAPDLVITHQVKSHFLMRLSRLWRQYPWIAFHHGYTTTDQRMRLYNRLNRWSLPKADRVITVCQAFADELAKAGVGRERISVLHNSISPQPAAGSREVHALWRRLNIAKDQLVVLAVGRLSQEKAHIDLVHAFKDLRDVHPEINAKLVIAGDGPERGRLEAAASSLGVNDRVVFVGEVRDVTPYYAAADVLANPSHSEGSPYVLLEAMAAGLPIVATSVGGVPEMVVDNESALLVPARDTQAMSAAIARTLTDASLARRLSANASALVSSRFSPDAYVRSLVEIYREVISSADKPRVSG